MSRNLVCFLHFLEAQMTKEDAARDAELSAQLKALTNQMKPLWAERKAIRDRSKAEKQLAREAKRQARAEEDDRKEQERLRIGMHALSLWGSGVRPKTGKGNIDWRLSEAALDCVMRPSDPLFAVSLRYILENEISLPVFDVTEMSENDKRTLEDALIAGGFTITRQSWAA
jgi:hypothetical protein